MNAVMEEKKPAGKKKDKLANKSLIKDLKKLQLKLDKTNAQMAVLFGVSVSTYQGWKYKARAIPPIAERLLRHLEKYGE